MKPNSLLITLSSVVLLLASAGCNTGTMSDQEFAIAFCTTLANPDLAARQLDLADTFFSGGNVRGTWQTETDRLERELRILEAMKPSGTFRDYHKAFVARTAFWLDYAKDQATKDGNARVNWRSLAQNPEAKEEYEQLQDDIRKTVQEMSGEGLIILQNYACL